MLFSIRMVIIVFHLLSPWCKLKNCGITLQNLVSYEKAKLMSMCQINLAVNYPGIITVNIKYIFLLAITKSSCICT